MRQGDGGLRLGASGWDEKSRTCGTTYLRTWVQLFFLVWVWEVARFEIASTWYQAQSDVFVLRQGLSYHRTERRVSKSFSLSVVNMLMVLTARKSTLVI